MEPVACPQDSPCADAGRKALWSLSRGRVGRGEKSSRGLQVTLWSDGSVTGERYGARDGMGIRWEVFESGGKRFLRFPFSIDGLP